MSQPLSADTPILSERTELAKYRLWIRIAEIVGTAVTTGLRYGGAVWIAYYAFRSVEALAGRTTAADIFVMGNVQISVLVSWAVGAGGVAYGWRQRALRHNVNATLGARVSELEGKLDAGRSSSKLTKRGQTDPKDLL